MHLSFPTGCCDTRRRRLLRLRNYLLLLLLLMRLSVGRAFTLRFPPLRRNYHNPHHDNDDNGLAARTVATTSKALFSSASHDDMMYDYSYQGRGLVLPSNSQRHLYTVEAPMVAASDYAFRCLCRQYNADLCFTQMLHARNLLCDHVFRQTHMDFYECQEERQQLQQPSSSCNHHHHDAMPAPPILTTPLLPSQKHFLQGYHRSMIEPTILSLQGWEQYTRGPLVVQLAGHEPDQVVEAAQRIVHATEGRVDGIDLNGGCPQQIARKGRYGAFLIESDDGVAAADVLSALRRALPASTAVSVKMRLPLDLQSDDALNSRMQRMLDTGIDFLTLHGRTLKENKTAVRACHIDRIARAVEMAQRHRPGFPVVANGGVERGVSDVERMRQTTGAVAVMSAEALLETPHLFAMHSDDDDNSSDDDNDDDDDDDDTQYARSRQVLQQQFHVARDYLGWCALYPPLPGVLGLETGTWNVVRSHLFKMLHRYLQEQPDLRNTLAQPQPMTLVQAHAFLNRLEERYNHLSDDQFVALDSSAGRAASWYRRHWTSEQEQQFQSEQDHALAGSSKTMAPSVEERKDALRQRIATLQAQRRQRITGQHASLS